MKKTIIIFAAAVAAMISCQKAETENIAPELTKITVVAENSLAAPGTKVTTGDAVTSEGVTTCPVLWQAGDRVSLIDRTANNDRTILAVTTIPSEYDMKSSAQLTFDVDFSENPTVKTLGLMVCREGFAYNDAKELPQDQVQKGTGAQNVNFMDYTYAYTNTTRSLYDNDGTMKDALSFSMTHPFAYVKIPFRSTEFAGYKVVSMTLTNTSDTKGRASGRVTIDGSASAPNAIATVYSSTNVVNLTFSEDVYVTAETQDAWLVALPTAIKGETAENTVYTVTFNLEHDGTSVEAVAKFNTILQASAVNVLNVGEIIESDVTSSKDISNDFFEQYLAGHDIIIGDLVVNKTNYPEYSLKKPSEITLSLLQGGGLIFIDDEEGTASIDLSTQNSTTSSKNLPSTKELVLIGRYKKAGTQTSLKLDECRTVKDLAIMNLKLSTSRSSQFFAKNSSDKTQTALRLQDCFIDNSNTEKLIEDTQGDGAASYSVINIDNCVIRLAATKSAWLFRTRYYAAQNMDISITNNVIYTSSLTNYQSQVFMIYNPDGLDTSRIILNVSDNTILNLHGNDALIRRGSKMLAENITVSGNLVATDNRDNNPVITTANNRNVFFVKNTGTPSGGNNFLTTINYTGDGNTINLSKMQSLTQISTDIVEQTLNPFTSLNYTAGYFPVDESVVTNGAGASYDTKYYIAK